MPPAPREPPRRPGKGGRGKGGEEGKGGSGIFGSGTLDEFLRASKGKGKSDSPSLFGAKGGSIFGGSAKGGVFGAGGDDEAVDNYLGMAFGALDTTHGWVGRAVRAKVLGVFLIL